MTLDRSRPHYSRLLGWLAAGALVVYLLGNNLVCLVDRDEPRFAQTSRQMLQSGDWILPRLYDQPRTAKPPLIYWLQAAAMAVVGDNSFAARLPSALAMVATLLLVGICIGSAVNRRTGFWSAFVLASCGLVVFLAKSCQTDSVLLLWITIAQICVYRIWRGRGTWPTIIILAAAIALAGLTKGPVVLGVLGMTLAALAALRGFDRWRGVHVGWAYSPTDAPRPAEVPGTVGEYAHPTIDGAGEPLPHGRGSENAPMLQVPPVSSPAESERSGSLSGSRPPTIILKCLALLAIVAAIVAPWLILVHRADPTFLTTAINHDVIDRSTGGLEGHKAPPGYYLATIWLTFMPWSLLLPLAMVSGWKRRHDPGVRFALAAAIGPWILFEIVQTKLPHYLLPVFPALAFLCASAIVRCLDGTENALGSRPLRIASLVWGAALVVMAAVPWLAARYFSPMPWAAMCLLGGVTIIYATGVIVLIRCRRQVAALVAMGGGMLVVMAVLYGVYLPRAQFLRVPIRLAAILKAQGATSSGCAIMLDYKEPSLAFYQGGTIRENKSSVLSDAVLDASPRWLVISDDVWQRTAPAVQKRVEEVGPPVVGLNLADGKIVRVMVMQKRR